MTPEPSPEPSHVVRAAVSDDDLRGILALQEANLSAALDPRERREQGFLTLRHDLPLLREMNAPFPHIIATQIDSPRVVAYALVMLPEFRPRLPPLEPMFRRLDALSAPGGPTHQRTFYIMGQVCIDKLHRGRGLLERLYAAHRARMRARFDLMITEIDRTNTRSLRAHERAGFSILDEYRADDSSHWRIVALELRRDAGGTG